MKTTTKTMLAMLGLGASALAVIAQEANINSTSQNGPSPRHGHRPPPPAIIAAIDANHDGVIDANEIANASAALKTLDKNGDGVLTPDEFDGRGHRPPPGDADSHSAKTNDAGGTPDNLPPGPPPDDN
jgi:hypothetical protein